MTAATRPARPPSLLREELRRAWKELRGGELSPARAAAAVALGLFVGSQPAFGCHTPVVLTVCVLLQLDSLIAWVAANISNPFFAVPLVTAEVQLGGYLHTGATLPYDRETFLRTGLDGFVLYAFTGSLVVGAGLALAGGTLTFAGVWLKRRLLRPGAPRRPYRLPPDAPAWWRATERVAARYAPPDRSTPAQRSRFHYVRVKLLLDPVTKMIADLFGEGEGVLGEVLDVGTGRGQLPVVLLELRRAERVCGIDWDETKIEAARRAAEREPPLGASFAVSDMRHAALPPADTVLLVDVLHYLALAEQDALLGRAAAAVRPGGRIILRDADTARGWRSWMTLGEELLFTTLRFNRGARVRLRPAREIVAALERAGLQCEVLPAWGSTPFANVLVIGRRPG